MDHNEIRHALPGYVDESLGPEDRAVVGEHLKTCSSCNLSLLELRRTLEHIRRLDQVDSPAWMTQKIMARVHEAAEKKKKPLRAWLFGDFRLPIEALGVVLLTVTAFLIYRNMQPVDRLSERAAIQSEATAPAAAPKDNAAKLEAVPPASTAPRTPAFKGQEKKSAVAPDLNEVPAPARQAAPRGSAESAAKLPAAPEVPQADDAGAILNRSMDLKAKIPESAGEMLVIRIRARGNESVARIEEAVREAGGAVVRREVSADAWVMTLRIDQSKHAALLSALRRVGKTEERTLAIDGREGREILMRGSDGPKPAVGC